MCRCNQDSVAIKMSHFRDEIVARMWSILGSAEHTFARMIEGRVRGRRVGGRGRRLQVCVCWKALLTKKMIYWILLVNYRPVYGENSSLEFDF